MSGLPKSTVEKIIKERLREVGSQKKVSKAFREKVGEMTEKFIERIAADSQDLCEGEKKKTIGNLHVIKAINNLGFDSFENGLKELGKKVAKDEKEKKERRKKRKTNNTGLTREQMIAEQKRLFLEAKKRNADVLRRTINKPKDDEEMKESSTTEKNLFDNKKVTKTKSNFFFGNK